MKILYISHKLPYPLTDGGKLRVFNHIKYLSEKHEVTSLSFIQDKKELEDIDELKRICDVETVKLPKWKSLLNTFLGLFSSQPLRNWYLKDKYFKEKAKRLTKESDFVIIQAPRMSQYSFKPSKTILDVVDTPSLQMKRAIKHERSFWKLIWRLELPRMLSYENKIKHRFNKIVVASQDDKEALGKGKVIKNGTTLTQNKRKRVNENNIMFLGNMEYPPNMDAVDHLVNHIFPKIKKEIKDAKLYIVGKNPRKIRKYKRKDVMITGFVSDIKRYFENSKVFVAPLRLGSGIQNKVLEALNYEVPVVTTPIVNKGIESNDVSIGENPSDFAKKTIKLLKNPKQRDELSKKAKIFLKKNYSWRNSVRKLEKLIKKSN